MTATHLYMVLAMLAPVPALWQWAEDRRVRKQRDRLSGLDRQRWDRLVPDADGPEIRISPETRDAARALLELAIDGDRADLMLRCREAAGEEFPDAFEACRLVAGYLVIEQCSWPAGDERLRRLANQVQDALLPADITRREIQDCLRDALTGPRPRDADGRLPGSVFPDARAAMVALLVTGQLLVRFRPEGWAWSRHLDWACNVLDAAGTVSLELIPALIQRP
ncbi:MAG: hypothetical protein FWE35_05150 [Streptosporangiales bacterium]|nr:hypothetical protein [Streptosporangiales bacterium]